MNNNNHTCLIYENIRLVPYRSEHDKQTVVWLNDPELRDNFGLTRNVTLSSHRKWLLNQKDLIIWAILDLHNIHQGNIMINPNYRHLSAYLQIYIGNKQSRGQGMGWNSLICVLCYSFEQAKLHRIWLHTCPDNLAAIQLYDKAGFVQEGVEREAIYNQGSFSSQMRYALLSHEWFLLKNSVFKEAVLRV